MRPLKQKLTIKKAKMRPLRQKWFAGPGPTGSPENQFLLQGTHFRRIFALRVRIFDACWLKTTSKMQPLRQKCTPDPLGTSEIQPLRQRGRRKCDPFSRKCTPDPLGTTKMQPLRQKGSSHAQIHPREAICPLSGRNGFQTRRNRSFFTCIGMPPELPNLGPRPPRICVTDLASTIIGPDINAKCTDAKKLKGSRTGGLNPPVSSRCAALETVFLPKSSHFRRYFRCKGQICARLTLHF